VRKLAFGLRPYWERGKGSGKITVAHKQENEDGSETELGNEGVRCDLDLPVGLGELENEIP
jgi:hypothetical protein